MRVFSKAHREKLSLAKKGKKLSQIHIDRIGQSIRKAYRKRNFGFPKGLVPWNKGTKGIMIAWNKGLKGQFVHTKDSKRKISRKLKGVNIWSKGRIWTDEQKIKLKGRPAWNKGLKGYHSGNQNPRWKGGITPTNRKIRESFEYRAWRISVFRRDKFRCVKCGNKKNIQADHIKPFRDYPELRFKISNGQTLCFPCHILKTKLDNKIQSTTTFQRTF